MNNLFTNLVEQYIFTYYKEQSFTINLIKHNEDDINKQNDYLHVSLFNTIKELLTNAHKHAAASQIDIQLSFNKKEKVLTYYMRIMARALTF